MSLEKVLGRGTLPKTGTTTGFAPWPQGSAETLGGSGTADSGWPVGPGVPSPGSPLAAARPRCGARARRQPIPSPKEIPWREAPRRPLSSAPLRSTKGFCDANPSTCPCLGWQGEFGVGGGAVPYVFRCPGLGAFPLTHLEPRTYALFRSEMLSASFHPRWLQRGSCLPCSPAAAPLAARALQDAARSRLPGPFSVRDF